MGGDGRYFNREAAQVNFFESVPLEIKFEYAVKKIS
jgi:hypothetical protein